MPTPTRFELHSEPHAWVMNWLGGYVVATPGVRIGDNATVRLDLENEVQPDALLRLDPALGGRSHIGEEGYLEGPPELIVEVAASMHDKKRIYARSGVQEYVAIQMYEGRIDWFALEEDVYETLAPDENGVLHSRVFAGLWLQPDAFWAGDPSTGSGQALVALLAVLQEGLASAEHADFVAHLQESGSLRRASEE